MNEGSKLCARGCRIGQLVRDGHGYRCTCCSARTWFCDGPSCPGLLAPLGSHPDSCQTRPDFKAPYRLDLKTGAVIQ